MTTEQFELHVSANAKLNTLTLPVKKTREGKEKCPHLHYIVVRDSTWPHKECLDCGKYLGDFD